MGATDIDDMNAANPPGGSDVMLRVSHFALLSGLAQFIPVPFVDDYADRRVRRQMVGQLLQRRGRSMDVGRVKPLWAGRDEGVLRAAGGLAKSLVMKPVKKLFRTVFFWFGIRRAILEATEVLALGHTIDRLLAAGWFPDDADDAQLNAAADRVVRAVEGASSGSDWRGLKMLVRKTARQFKNAKLPFRRSEALSTEEQAALEAASVDLKQRLETEEAQSVLARFDTDVDRRLAVGSL